MKSESIHFRRLLLLGVQLLAISALHYLTPTTLPLLHQIYRRLYFVPILIGAYWFGVRGGIVTAVLSTLLYVPHILIHWRHNSIESAGQYGEIVMFYVIGTITGLLSDREQQVQDQYRGAALELRGAYAKLQDSMEQIRRADRLSAVGQLAAGMAHEIRNPLGSIKNAVDLLLDDLPEDHPSGEFAEILTKETRRLQRLLEDFLQFARPSPPSFGKVDLKQLVPRIRRLLQKEAERSGISLSFDLAEGLPPIRADEAQLSQVLVNLVLNALQVQEDEGDVRIRVDLDEEIGEVERKEERTVLIRIEDAGPGIAVDVKERLFDPFFTTRKDGTGLGLSVAYAILEAHGGKIRAGNLPEGGAVFTVSIPVWTGPEEHD